MPRLGHARTLHRGATMPRMRTDSRDAMHGPRTQPAACDQASRRWTQQLQIGHPRREQTVSALHALLLKSARYELSRRRAQLRSVSGPEFDDLAQQAADDALMKVLAKLEQFAGLSRFTTWTYKFVIFEISRLVSRHAWQRQPPRADELEWERLADSSTAGPAQRAEGRERLSLLATAVDQLTDRQREVFVAVALNDVPIDVLALELGSNRNAIYKNLFDARRSLRKSMAAGGHPVFPEDRDRD